MKGAAYFIGLCTRHKSRNKHLQTRMASFCPCLHGLLYFLFSTRHPLDSPPIIRGRSFAPSRSQFELQQRGKKEEEEEEDEKHGGRMNEWNSFRHLPPPPLHAWAAPFAFDVVGNDNDEKEKRGEE